MDAKVAVCTCIIPHDYVQLKPPLYVNWDKDQVHYWVISDEPHMILPWWDLIIVRDPALSSRRDLQRYKILTHEILPEYDYVIWHDGNFQLKVDPLYLVALLKDSGRGIGFVEHFQRDCLYQEAEICLGFQSVDPKKVETQLSSYRACGFPEHFGLVETGFFIRSQNDLDILRLTERWYEETMQGCCKNQISFPFASWVEEVPYWTIPWEILDPGKARSKSDIWQDNALFRRHR